MSARLLLATSAIAAAFLVAAAPGRLQAADVYGSTGTNLSVPDNNTWVHSTISISGAPSGATVTGIDVHFSAIHPYEGDLDVDLNDSGITRNYDLWANEGGSADNPSRTVYNIHTFDGLPVNGSWYLYARDTAAGDSGYIDEWWIRIYYSSGTNTYAVYGKIDALSNGVDADGDGYFETFNFNICLDADAVPGPADVYAKLISVTTGQAWWSTNPWTVSGTSVDYRCFPFSEADFSGYLNGNTDLDFTVEIWNSTRSTKLATDTSVTGEPVKADRANVYAAYARISNLLNGVDADNDGYFETYHFDLCVDADASPGPISVYAKLISTTTNQAWWSANPWTISGTTTDYQCFAFTNADFTGVSGNTNLDFTVEIWNAAKVVKLATDASVDGEPVRADHARDTAGPKIGSGRGVLGDTKTHIDTYYDDGIFGFFDKYLLEDHARRSTENPHGHNGQMTSSAVIETLLYDAGLFSNYDKMEDDDNIWDATSQRSGVDAQVYTDRVYDYLRSQLSLNSPNGAGGSMSAAVEVPVFADGRTCRDNAYWDGTRVQFCIPQDIPSYAGAQDVVAHEWGHAVTGLVGAGLNYTGESGSLNEAFSDWLGAAVDSYYSSGSVWLHGAAVRPGGDRSLSDPPSLSYWSPVGTRPYPDTYGGTGWWSSTDGSWDNYGVHENSSVANKMFYLLANGGTHNGITVAGLGVTTAIKIALDSNRTRWSATSDFASARAGMILAGHAVSSTAEAQVKNAWAAVGVGDPAVTLTGLAINGPSSLNESGSATYAATASWSDGTTSTVTPTWSESSSFTTISAAGVLTASAVTSDQTVTVSASYTYARTTRTASKTVTILNVRVLTGLAISGPATVNENSSATYTATASWDDGTTSSVTSAWSESSAYTTITASGVLTATAVTGDQAVTVSASYTFGGVTRTASKAVTIVNTGRALTALSIQGPSSVNESSAATFTATASWDDGTSSAVAPVWSEDSPYASINSSGVLTTSVVTANQTVTVSASYTFGGMTKTAAKGVAIVNSVNVLVGLSISGPSAVNESSTAAYTATASWDNGTTSTVTPAWSEDSPYASINSSGVLTTSVVTANQTVTVSASYTSGGVTRTAAQGVSIINSVKVLVGLSISGPSAVNEGSSAVYTAMAAWDDGTASSAAASWSENSAVTTISSAGVLTASSVSGDQTVTVSAGYTSGGVTATAAKVVTIVDAILASDLYVVTPCRLVDTRNPEGPRGGPALSSGVQRVFGVVGSCGIPSTAKAVVLNVTAVGATGIGYLTLSPGNLGPLQTSTVNFAAGIVRASNAIMELATNGDGTLAALASVAGSGQVDLILDVSGYFQ